MRHPIQTGLCAYGMSGQIFHAPFLSCMEEFDFVAVTERHTKKAGARYPQVTSYASVDEMLNNPELELIIVNTPNVTHFEYAKNALLAGKHVVVEKPFAATDEEAKILVTLAKEQSKSLMVYQNRRWDSDFKIVKKVIEEKKLGSLIEANIHYDRYKMEPSAKKHKEKADPGVGLIYDLGPHIIDQAIALFGKPKAVFARVQHHRPESLVDDYFSIQLLYPNFNCTLKSSLLVREQGPGYILHGTEGSFLKSRSNFQEDRLKEGISPCNSDWGEEPEEDKGLLHTTQEGETIRQYISSPKGDYKGFYKAVYQHIREGQPFPIPLSDVLLNMRIIEAAIKSQENKMVVNLD